MKIVAFLTSIAAWFVKNVNMVVGVIGAIGKVAAGLINIFQPSQDGLVDLIEAWTERIQKALFRLSELLKKFTGSTG